MARRSKENAIDWGAIEAAFKTTPKTASELARDFGLPPSTVTRHAAKCGWWGGRRAALLSAPRELTDQTSGFIYVASVSAGEEKSFKIGKAIRVDERIKAHQVSCPLEIRLEVSYFARDMHSEERMLHMCFADQRIRGEWFRLSDADLAFIAGRCVLASTSGVQ